MGKARDTKRKEEGKRKKISYNEAAGRVVKDAKDWWVLRK